HREMCVNGLPRARGSAAVIPAVIESEAERTLQHHSPGTVCPPLERFRTSSGTGTARSSSRAGSAPTAMGGETSRLTPIAGVTHRRTSICVDGGRSLRAGLGLVSRLRQAHKAGVVH